MRRISTSTKVTDKFGPGKHGFTNGNAVGGVASTDLEGEWFDHLQEEVAGVCEAAGLVLDQNNRAQLLEAIQLLAGGVVGTMRNGRMVVSAASASGTLTADEVIVGASLAGRRYRLANFNKTINLATTGAGGMDTGAAPANGYVGLYAIYNPTTGASALLAVNAATLLPEVYGGASMPSGYTASALVSVRATNASGQFTVGYQVDRHVTVASVASGTFSTALTDASTTLAVPNNAKSVDLATSQTTASGASQYNLAIAGSSPVLGGTAMANPSINVSGITSFNMTNTIYLLTARTVFITWTVIGGSSPVLGLAIAGYTF